MPKGVYSRGNEKSELESMEREDGPMKATPPAPSGFCKFCSTDYKREPYRPTLDGIHKCQCRRERV